jgi:hypothetical protein
VGKVVSFFVSRRQNGILFFHEGKKARLYTRLIRLEKHRLDLIPLDADIDEFLDGCVERIALRLGREQLDLLHDVDAPARLEIRRVQVPHGRVNGGPVVVPGRGVDLGKPVHGAVPELARVRLGGGGRPGGGEEAVSVGLDLPAVVEAEDHRRRRGLGLAQGARGLPRDAALPDPVQAAALLVLERPDGVPPGGRGGRRGGGPGWEWRRGSGGWRQCLGDGGA